MRNRLISLISVIAVGTAAISFAHAADERSGQNSTCPAPVKMLTSEQAQAAMRAARDRGFLWHVSKDGHTSHLYGTFHMGQPDWMIGPTVLRALAGSDRLALELDLSDPAMLQRTGAAALGRKGTPMPDALTARLRALAERNCLPDAFGLMMPELQAMTLGMAVYRNAGMYAEYGSEFLLSGAARALHKPVTSLETPELQMEALRSKNAEEARTIVTMMLDQLDSGEARAVIEHLIATWAESRLDELQRYRVWCKCADSELARRWLARVNDDRNPGLASGIAAIHERGESVFAAIGSLHMIGPNGVVALLAKRGYRVEHVPFAGFAPTRTKPPLRG